MKITFIPQRRDDDLVVSRRGEALDINGDILDFTMLPEGGTLPPEGISNSFVLGSVARTGGEISISVLLPRSSSFGVFDEAGVLRDPIVVVNHLDGEVALPPEPHNSLDEETGHAD